MPDYGPHSETAEGPTLSHLRQRAGSGGWRSPPGSSSATFAISTTRSSFATPDGEVHFYRKRNLVFWERFRFRPGREPLVVSTPYGRIGFAICADMIYRKVWDDYRGRIDLAVVVRGLAGLRRPGYRPQALAFRPCWAALGSDPGQGGD